MRAAFFIIFFSLSYGIISQKKPNNSYGDYLKHFYEFYQLLVLAHLYDGGWRLCRGTPHKVVAMPMHHIIGHQLCPAQVLTPVPMADDKTTWPQTCERCLTT